MIRSIVVVVYVLLLCAGSVRSAQPEEVRRLRGIIDKDETWSGTILITDNLSIVGATVRVAPGTIIEFAGGNPNRRPVLTVGAEPNPTRLAQGVQTESNVAPGRLEMEGTGDRPIIVRTAAGSGSGRIVVTVRSVVPPARLEAGKIAQSAPATPEPDRLDWQHVRFERLGNSEQRREMSRDVEFWQPGVQVLIREGGHGVILEHCEFRECAHLLVQTDEACEVLIRACRFDKSADPSSVKLQSLDENIAARSIQFVENFAAGMLTVGAGPCQVSQNRFIGESAGVAVRAEAAGEISVVSNYAHCTDASDKGRYVLTVEQPDAIVRDNVLIGGAYVIYQGARVMKGNVLIAAQRLSDDKGGKARTRRLIASLPSGAILENNLLIGPALALIGPQRSLRQPRGNAEELDKFTGAPARTSIRNNAFDGFDHQSRVMQLGLPRSEGGAVEFFNNLVVRCGVMVADSTMKSDAVIYADFNAIVGGPPKLFQGAVVSGLKPDEDGWSKNDRRFDSADEVLIATMPDTVADFDEKIMDGTMTIEVARRRYRDAYQFRKTIGMGRSVNGQRRVIGFVER